MQSRTKHDPRSTATQGDIGLAEDSELSILRDVFRMLPTGVTVQDEHGGFVRVNDAAAVKIGITVGEPAAASSEELNHRREAGLELLRSGRPAVTEECVTSGPVKQVFLTAHRPVRIAVSHLVLSTSVDLGE